MKKNKTDINFVEKIQKELEGFGLGFLFKEQRRREEEQQRLVGEERERKRRKEQSRRQKEINRRQKEINRQKEKEEKEKKERIQSIIATSSSNSIIGYCIIKQLEMVSHSDTLDEEEAKQELKDKAAKLGANAIINIRIVRSRGGEVSIQGDAVIVRDKK